MACIQNQGNIRALADMDRKVWHVHMWLNVYALPHQCMHSVHSAALPFVTCPINQRSEACQGCNTPQHGAGHAAESAEAEDSQHTLLLHTGC